MALDLGQCSTYGQLEVSAGLLVSWQNWLMASFWHWCDQAQGFLCACKPSECEIHQYNVLFTLYSLGPLVLLDCCVMLQAMAPPTPRSPTSSGSVFSAHCFLAFCAMAILLSLSIFWASNGHSGRATMRSLLGVQGPYARGVPRPDCLEPGSNEVRHAWIQAAMSVSPPLPLAGLSVKAKQQQSHALHVAQACRKASPWLRDQCLPSTLQHGQTLLQTCACCSASLSINGCASYSTVHVG